MGDEKNQKLEIKDKASFVLDDLLAYTCVLACIATLAYQAYMWLQDDNWVELPLFDLFDKISWFNSWSWIHHPDSLFTLHDVVTYFLNLGLAAFFALIAAAFFAIGMRDK